MTHDSKVPRVPRILVIGAVCVTTAAAGAAYLDSTTSPRPARSVRAATDAQPLFGDATVRGGISAAAPGRARAFRFWNRRAGTATTIALYVDRRTRARSLTIGLYSSRGAGPGRSLVASRRVVPRRGGWNIVRVRATPVRAGTLYWLAVLGAGGRLYLRHRAGRGCGSSRSGLAGFHSLPHVWPRRSVAGGACPISAYVGGEPAAIRTGGVGGTPSRLQVNCAGAPGSDAVSQASLDACGYPSMDSTGPAAGTALTSSPGFTASRPGAVYNGLNVNGAITVTADNVTIENSNITDTDLSNAAINIQNGVTGTRILNDSIHGTDNGNHALAYGVSNLYGATLGSVVIDHTNFYNGDRILVGYGTVTNSYCLGGATFGSEHDECVYTSGGTPGISLVHDTLLNANPYQTAAVFIDSPDGSGSNGQGAVEIENSLLGGGGYCIYGGEGSAGTHHTGPETIVDNRFAGLYFPRCGQFGATAYMPSDLVWSGNVWDVSNRPVRAP